jgi:hypothetical protein
MINDWDPLRDSALQKSQLSSLASSQNDFTQSSWSTSVCPLTNQWLWITLTLRALEVSNFPPALSPGVLSPTVDDPSTCVFWNRWSIYTLAFGSFWPNATCHIFPFWSAHSSRLHDLSPHGEMMEKDTWPNQVGDMCHVLINFSIFQKLKSYWHVAHIPCVHVILGDVCKPHHFRDSRVHNTSRWCHRDPSLWLFELRGFESFQTSTLPFLPNSEFLKSKIFRHVSSWIERPRFTSGLHPKSTDILHVSSSIPRLCFTLGLSTSET